MDQLFDINQEVTPIRDDFEVFAGIKPIRALPKIGETYHVSAYRKFPMFKNWFITLKELPQGDWYMQECFSPVLPQEAIDELVKESFEKVEEISI